MFCLASDWVFRSCYLQTPNSATGPSSKCVSAEKVAVKKRQPGLLDEFIKLRQERTMKDDNQRFLVYDKAKKHRGPFRKLSVSFQRTNPNMFFLASKHNMAQSAPPQGVYGLWAKTVSVQETTWRPPFHAVLGSADAGILPKPHRFEETMEMDILE